MSRISLFLASRCVLVAVVVLLSACATKGPRMAVERPEPVEFPVTARVFDAETGVTMDAALIPAMMEKADIVVVGERHDDAVGHAVELALVDQFLTLHPRGAVAMEMLERHEQHLVDAYLAGEIDLEEFLDRTGSASWAPKGMWEEWYQPIIDRVRDEPRAKLIAANAPRQYVTMAREEDYLAIEKLPPLERPMVDVPLDADVAEYRTRFFDTMKHHQSDGGEDGGHGAPALTDEQIEAYFRSQRIWDATMGASVARAASKGTPVLLIVGGFHTDQEGGLLSEIRARLPRARILTMSVLPNDAEVLTEEDRVRARLVVYTPMPADEEEGEEAHDDESDDSPES